MIGTAVIGIEEWCRRLEEEQEGRERERERERGREEGKKSLVSLQQVAEGKEDLLSGNGHKKKKKRSRSAQLLFISEIR